MGTTVEVITDSHSVCTNPEVSVRPAAKCGRFTAVRRGHKTQSLQMLDQFLSATMDKNPLILYQLLCLVDCVWAAWSEFSSCDKSCGGGTMYKTRTKLVSEKYGGSCYGEHRVEKPCNTHKCPGKFPYKVRQTKIVANFDNFGDC